MRNRSGVLGRFPIQSRVERPGTKSHSSLHDAQTKRTSCSRKLGMLSCSSTNAPFTKFTLAIGTFTAHMPFDRGRQDDSRALKIAVQFE